MAGQPLDRLDVGLRERHLVRPRNVRAALVGGDHLLIRNGPLVHALLLPARAAAGGGVGRCVVVDRLAELDVPELLLGHLDELLLGGVYLAGDLELLGAGGLALLDLQRPAIVRRQQPRRVVRLLEGRYSVGHHRRRAELDLLHDRVVGVAAGGLASVYGLGVQLQLEQPLVAGECLDHRQRQAHETGGLARLVLALEQPVRGLDVLGGVGEDLVAVGPASLGRAAVTPEGAEVRRVAHFHPLGDLLALGVELALGDLPALLLQLPRRRQEEHQVHRVVERLVRQVGRGD